MAVADVYTAISEDRPYRKGMQRSAAKQLLQRMVANGALDGSLVECLCDNIATVEGARVEAQTTAVARYETFWQEVNSAIYVYREL